MINSLSSPVASFRRPALTLLELLVAVAICAILVGLLLPAVQKVRDSANRVACAGHLREIGIALHHYNDTHGHLPEGSAPWVGYNWWEIFDASMPWHVRLLPFIEQDGLFQKAAWAYTVDHHQMNVPPHVGDVVLPIYLCPAESRRVGGGASWHWATTSYLGVSGPVSANRLGVLYCLSKTRLTDISDGTTETLMVGERPPGADLKLGEWYYGGFGAGPTEAGMANNYLGVRESTPTPLGCPSSSFRPGRINDRCDDYHFWSLHAGGANFAFADGSVRFLSYSADAVIKALSTRAGGEIVPGDF